MVYSSVELSSGEKKICGSSYGGANIKKRGGSDIDSYVAHFSAQICSQPYQVMSALRRSSLCNPTRSVVNIGRSGG